MGTRELILLEHRLEKLLQIGLGRTNWRKAALPVGGELRGETWHVVGHINSGCSEVDAVEEAGW